VSSLHLVIQGNLQSKANSRRAISIRSKTTGRHQSRFIKSKAALDYQEDALWQLAPQLRGHKPFSGDVGLRVTVYYRSKRNDLDISLLMDILEKAGIILNDRLVREFYARKEWDKINPRLDVVIYEVPN
jgi:Holliday junction resolvase RusA-like endonuclease